MRIRAPGTVTLATMLAALAAPPAAAAPLVTLPTALDFAVADHSMWGDIPAIFDTGLLAVGKYFPEPGKTALQQAVSFDLGTQPAIEGTFRLSGSGGASVDFRAILDSGSVSADYRSQARLTVDEQAPAGGTRRFVLTSSEPGGSSASFNTVAPNIDVEANLRLDLQAAASGNATVVFRESTTVCGPLGNNCVTVPASTVSGALPSTEVVDVSSTKQILKATNEDVKIFGNSIADRNALLREESNEEQLAVTFDIGFDPIEWATGTGAGLDIRIVDESNPKRPSKSKNLDPKDIVSAAFSMGDITLYAPVLDTAADDFVAPGGTHALSASGMTKVAKVDLDVDFLATTGLGLSTGVPVPFGVTLEVGVGPVRFSQEIDLIDADIGAVLFAGQQFDYAPRARMTLEFSDDVRYRLAGEAAWRTGAAVEGFVGDQLEIEYDGTGDLSVSPTYSLDGGFHNRTNLLVGEQLAIDLFKFAVRAPFGFPLVGPVLLANFVFETPNQIPLADIFDQAVDLGFGTIAAPTLTLGGIDGGAVGEFAAELKTGSPTSLTQAIDTPDEPFAVAFDYLFETGTGTLTVLLDGIAIGTLTATGEPMDDVLSAVMPVLDPLLFGRAGIDLTFLFDGPTGAVLLLDNAGLLVAEAGFVGLGNGDFQSGNLANWVGVSSIAGRTGVRRLAVAAAVPAPPALALLLPALGALAFGTLVFGVRRR